MTVRALEKEGGLPWLVIPGPGAYPQPGDSARYFLSVFVGTSALAENDRIGGTQVV